MASVRGGGGCRHQGLFLRAVLPRPACAGQSWSPIERAVAESGAGTGWRVAARRGGGGAGLWLLLPPHVAGGRRTVRFVRSSAAASPSGSPRVTGAMALAKTYPAASSLPNGDCGRPRARPGGNRVTVVLGAQWGDEGKGKVVDLLAQDADIVCRCQVRRRASHGRLGPGAPAAWHLVPRNSDSGPGSTGQNEVSP